ncbi:MAG: RHS repeat-associated core domain-containing protein, partial [Planctomycetes bacterium]|nr:RHS repeat-associated core domain-containing protein [Planctomycetota bacterium]
MSAQVISNGHVTATPAVRVLDNNHYYTDFPLPVSGSIIAQISGSDANGSAAHVSKLVSWSKTDIRVRDGAIVVIREGDSLLLTATSVSTSAPGTVMTIDPGTPSASQGMITGIPGAAFPVQYPTAGVYTVAATIDDGWVGTINVKVLGNPVFDQSTILCQTEFSRGCNVSLVTDGSLYTATSSDSALLDVTNALTNYANARLTITPHSIAPSSIIMRQSGPTGPIICFQAVQAFLLELDDVVAGQGTTGTISKVVMRPFRAPILFSSMHPPIASALDAEVGETVGVVSLPTISSFTATATTASVPVPALFQVTTTGQLVAVSGGPAMTGLIARLLLSTTTDFHYNPILVTTDQDHDGVKDYQVVGVNVTMGLSGITDPAELARLESGISYVGRPTDVSDYYRIQAGLPLLNTVYPVGEQLWSFPSSPCYPWLSVVNESKTVVYGATCRSRFGGSTASATASPGLTYLGVEIQLQVTRPSGPFAGDQYGEASITASVSIVHFDAHGHNVLPADLTQLASGGRSLGGFILSSDHIEANYAMTSFSISFKAIPGIHHLDFTLNSSFQFGSTVVGPRDFIVTGTHIGTQPYYTFPMIRPGVQDTTKPAVLTNSGTGITSFVTSPSADPNTPKPSPLNVSFDLHRNHARTPVVSLDHTPVFFSTALDAVVISNISYSNPSTFAGPPQSYYFQGSGGPGTQYLYEKDDEVDLTTTSLSYPVGLPPLKSTIRLFRKGAGASDGIDPCVSLMAQGQTNVVRGNLFMSFPIRSVTTPDMGPDLFLSYNSCETMDSGMGPGWRTNYDMRWLTSFTGDDGLSVSDIFIDETGRRIDSTGPVIGVKFTTSGNPNPDVQTVTGAFWRKDEITSVNRGDNRILFFDKDGWLVRIATIDGSSLAISRDTNHVATLVVDERHPSRNLSLVSLIGNEYALNKPSLALLNKELSGTWAFRYDAQFQMLTAKISGDGPTNHGDFKLTGGLNFQTYTFSYDAPANGLQRLSGLDYSGGLSAVITPTFNASTFKVLTQCVVTDALGGLTIFPNTPTVDKWLDMTDAAGVVHHRTIVPQSGQTIFTQFTGANTNKSISTFDPSGHLFQRDIQLSGTSIQTTKFTWSDLGVGANVMTEQREVAVAGLDVPSCDGDDLTTSYTYFGKDSGFKTGKLKSMTDPNGHSSLIAYDADGHQLSVIDARGKKWDTLGRTTSGVVTKTSSPMKRETSMTVDDFGVATHQKSFLPYAWDLTNDQMHRTITTTNPGGILTGQSFDPLGRQTKTSDALNRSVSLTYDALGRQVLMHTDPAGADPSIATTPIDDTVTTYMKSGSLWTVTTTTGLIVHQQILDVAGRLMQDISPCSLVNGVAGSTPCTSTNTYDPISGFLVAVKDARQHDTTLEYDLAGRLLATVSPEGLRRSNTYNGLGWVLTSTNANLATLSNRYLRSGGVARTVNPAGGWVQYGYDELGQLASQQVSSGIVSLTTRDDDGMINGSVDSFGVVSHSTIETFGAGARKKTWIGSSGASLEQEFDNRNLPSVTSTRVGALLFSSTVDVRNDGSLSKSTSSVGSTNQVKVDGFGRSAITMHNAVINNTSADLTALTTYQAGTGIPTASTSATGLGTLQIVEPTTGQVNQTQNNAATSPDGNPSPIAPSAQVLSRDQNGNVLRSGMFSGTETGSSPTPSLVTVQTYDMDNRLKTRTGPDGVTTTWNYVGDRAQTVVTSPDNATVTYGYDVQGHVTSVTDASSRVQTSVFDATGRLLRSTKGQETTLYDYHPTTGVLLAVHAPGDRTTRYEYDSRGRRSAVIDPNGHKTAFLYDDLDRLITTIFPAAEASSSTTSEKLTYVKDSSLVATHTGRDLRFTAYTYVKGQLTQESIQVGSVTTTVDHRLERDVDGGPLRSVVVEGGVSMTSHMDRANRVLSLEAPGSSAVPFAYDRAGRVTTRGSMTFGYNASGQMENVLQDGIQLATIGYDSKGRMSSQTLPNETSRQFTYEFNGMLAGVAQQAGITNENWTVMRNSEGRMSQLTGTDHAISYLYHNGRLQRETRTGSDPSDTRYGYDANDNRVSAVAYGGAATQHVVTFPDSTIPASVHPTTGTWTSGNGVLTAIGSSTATLFSPSDLLKPDFSVTVAPTPSLTSVSGAGWLIASTTGSYRVLWQVRPSQSSVFNAPPYEGRAVIQQVQGSTIQDLEFSVWIDDTGIARALQLEHHPDESLSLTVVLDATSSIALSTPAPGIGAMPRGGAMGLIVTSGASFSTLMWSTATGRTGTSSQFNNLDQLTHSDQVTETGGVSAAGATDYFYNLNGECTQRTQTPYGGGAENTMYGYDAHGHLASVSGVNMSAAYGYAPGGWARLQATVNGVTTNFQWDGTNVVSETTGGVTTTYGYVGSQALWQKSGSTMLVYGRDLFGNITGHVGSFAGISGHGYVRRFSYDAFGATRETIPSQIMLSNGALSQVTYGPATSPSFGMQWRGEYRDATGLTYLRNRYYDPGIGRFTSSDPAKAGSNWYAYCGGDPVNRADPSGLDWEWIAGDDSTYLRWTDIKLWNNANGYWSFVPGSNPAVPKPLMSLDDVVACGLPRPGDGSNGNPTIDMAYVRA